MAKQTKPDPRFSKLDYPYSAVDFADGCTLTSVNIERDSLRRFSRVPRYVFMAGPVLQRTGERERLVIPVLNNERC